MDTATLKTKKNEKVVTGKFVQLNTTMFYKIAHSDSMRPFFMSIISDANHWMFISSNGGLTAGRKNAEHALFPYYTDDKITEMAETTGSKTIFRVHQNGKTVLWEPFSIRQTGLYATEINLYKSIYGNTIIFEEKNLDLNLTYKYQWSSSNRFGFVKTATLENNNQTQIQIEVLDGLQNIMPASVSSDLQNRCSNLVDAYKKNELHGTIGVYALSAVIVDKAEPSEALKANIVWSTGFKNPLYLLSSLQLDAFRKGEFLVEENDVKAEKGAYFINSNTTLNAGETTSWQFIANVNQSISDIVKLSNFIAEEHPTTLQKALENDIALGTENLIKLGTAADGIQLTEDPLIRTRHFSNTLFNIMRGGIFDDDYNIEKKDFLTYLENANTTVFKAKVAVCNNLPETFSLYTIKRIAEADSNSDFKRLCFEYLPLKFSRRHGDPSRPWNKFSINTRSEIDGSKILDYEGNWRDIFQNWEALAHAYPEFIESMIHKFLNASTFEGYNPYRVTKGGFDWEVIEPHDPWSYIGYWGDHQIIYLLKFLEFSEAYYPDQLSKRFDDNIFVYANVPYKIKSYEDTLNNPKDTITFDEVLDEQIRAQRQKIGADGALLVDANQTIYKVNLIEKLLATVLSKLSNFIPEAGIWLNTQRPEWNDANNALVGNGVSMVTLYYLYRFLNVLEKCTAKSTINHVNISSELYVFFNTVNHTFQDNSALLKSNINDTDRKTILDGLGAAGSTYRNTIYKHGFSGEKTPLQLQELLRLITTAKAYLKHSIEANKRDDNMYHAYNIISINNANAIHISYLSEMLEGQVAVLSSGYLNSKQVLHLLDGLKASALFREDQYSYILYPDKELPRFDKKNNIPESAIQKSKLLQELIKNSNTQIVEKDANNQYHFNSNFNNANSLKSALKLLDESYKPLVNKETHQLLDVFELVFNHKAFTGRSGTFFGYEGLGSIYWHMVSKLALAVQENCLKAINEKENPKIIGRLLDHYYEITAGIGVHKSPELYGAFPVDPYSHTPATKGAQQPGMTGQVKEDILCRIGELGIIVTDGQLQFKPHLLQQKEFLKTPKTFQYTAVNHKTQYIDLEPKSLCFTYCQVPVIYRLAAKEYLMLVFNDGREMYFENTILDAKHSASIFQRQGDIEQIVVSVKK